MRIGEVKTDENQYVKGPILIFTACKISGHIVLDWKILLEITEYYMCPCCRHLFMILNIVWTQKLWAGFNLKPAFAANSMLAELRFNEI
jgi:hypothetical protein